jgi:hypothetical protein
LALRKGTGRAKESLVCFLEKGKEEEKRIEGSLEKS